jgi:hypothetical protein
MVAAGLCTAVSACSNLWGFQDGVPGSSDAGQGLPVGNAGLPEGGQDAGADVAAAPKACALTCVAAPPSGWNGPYALSETTGGPPAPAPAPCSDGAYVVEAFDGLALPSAPATSCECACGPATGGSCEEPTMTLYRDGMCSSASQCANVVVASGTCVDFDPGCGAAHIEVSPPAPIPGTCEASATTRIPDAGWGASARLCKVREPSSGQCDVGEVCTPPVGLPFESAYCIAMAGLSPCPSGPYVNRRVYYGAATDTRGCTACSCDPPSADCEGGTVSTFDAMGCAAPAHHTWSTPQSCTGIGKDTSGKYNGDAVLNSGACRPRGGVPTGELTPTTPTTICCTP